MKNLSFLHKIILLPLKQNIHMPSNHSILTWKSCHSIFLAYSFVALQWHPPWASPRLPQWAMAVESSIRGGSRASQKPRAYHWRDCRVGKTLVPDLLFPWTTHSFPLLENSKSLVTGVSQHGHSLVPHCSACVDPTPPTQLGHVCTNI